MYIFIKRAGKRELRNCKIHEPITTDFFPLPSFSIYSAKWALSSNSKILIAVIPSSRQSFFTVCILTSNRKNQAENIEGPGLKKGTPIFLRMASLEAFIAVNSVINFH